MYIYSGVYTDSIYTIVYIVVYIQVNRLVPRPSILFGLNPQQIPQDASLLSHSLRRGELHVQSSPMFKKKMCGLYNQHFSWGGMLMLVFLGSVSQSLQLDQVGETSLEVGE